LRRLPTKWVVERWERVSKKSMEKGGKKVNHSKVGPLRVVKKALQKMASTDVYTATWVTYVFVRVSVSCITIQCEWFLLAREGGGGGGVVMMVSMKG